MDTHQALLSLILNKCCSLRLKNLLLYFFVFTFFEKGGDEKPFESPNKKANKIIR